MPNIIIKESLVKTKDGFFVYEFKNAILIKRITFKGAEEIKCIEAKTSASEEKMTLYSASPNTFDINYVIAANTFLLIRPLFVQPFGIRIAILATYDLGDTIKDKSRYVSFSVSSTPSYGLSTHISFLEQYISSAEYGMRYPEHKRMKDLTEVISKELDWLIADQLFKKLMYLKPDMRRYRKVRTVLEFPFQFSYSFRDIAGIIFIPLDDNKQYIPRLKQKHTITSINIQKNNNICETCPDPDMLNRLFNIKENSDICYAYHLFNGDTLEVYNESEIPDTDESALNISIDGDFSYVSVIMLLY